MFFLGGGGRCGTPDAWLVFRLLRVVGWRGAGSVVQYSGRRRESADLWRSEWGA